MTISDAYHNTYSWRHRILHSTTDDRLDNLLFLHLLTIHRNSATLFLVSITFCTTILPQAKSSLNIECYSHKGQVCVSSSVPKSDSQGARRSQQKQGDWSRFAYPVQRSYGISVEEWSDQPLVPAQLWLLNLPVFHQRSGCLGVQVSHECWKPTCCWPITLPLSCITLQIAT